jgi:hypothetical protein
MIASVFCIALYKIRQCAFESDVEMRRSYPVSCDLPYTREGCRHLVIRFGLFRGLNR